MEMTRKIFERECKRHFGSANPERMRVPCWEWMVRRGGNPYSARVSLGLDLNYPARRLNPDWSFDRFGMSRTPMPDGRIICIAGEHEDSYDPDFCIYNDVIVLRPAPGEAGVTMNAGEVEIYGYPETTFPPTDFHSATLVDGKIIVIGRLGYQDTRSPGTTPVLAVDATTYRVEPFATAGPCPGWVFKHHATYDAARHAITVRGGKLDEWDLERDTPNFAAHRLHLADGRWELLAARELHRRFALRAAVEDYVHLTEPEADAFRPANVPHQWLPPEDRGVPAYMLDVHGVRVTFEEFLSNIRVLVEGDLAPEVTSQLLEDVSHNLRRTTGARWTIEEVPE